MKVSSFMIPVDKVVSVSPTDTVRQVMDIMLSKKIGALVVMAKNDNSQGLASLEGKNDPSILVGAETQSLHQFPVGIITKSDILKAFKNQVSIDDPCEKIMYKDKLATCTPNQSRDQAARILEQNHFHHLLVVDEAKERFLGLLSSWDITAECAKDDRAWPWIRSEGGRIHPQTTTSTRTIPSRRNDAVHQEDSDQHEHHETILNHDHGHDEFATYMDDLDLVALQ